MYWFHFTHKDASTLHPSVLIYYHTLEKDLQCNTLCANYYNTWCYTQHIIHSIRLFPSTCASAVLLVGIVVFVTVLLGCTITSRTWRRRCSSVIKCQDAFSLCMRQQQQQHGNIGTKFCGARACVTVSNKFWHAKVHRNCARAGAHMCADTHTLAHSLVVVVTSLHMEHGREPGHSCAHARANIAFLCVNVPHICTSLYQLIQRNFAMAMGLMV